MLKAWGYRCLSGQEVSCRIPGSCRRNLMTWFPDPWINGFISFLTENIHGMWIGSGFHTGQMCDTHLHTGCGTLEFHVEQLSTSTGIAACVTVINISGFGLLLSSYLCKVVVSRSSSPSSFFICLDHWIHSKEKAIQVGCILSSLSCLEAGSVV